MPRRSEPPLQWKKDRTVARRIAIFVGAFVGVLIGNLLIHGLSLIA